MYKLNETFEFVLYEIASRRRTVINVVTIIKLLKIQNFETHFMSISSFCILIR